jgi:hypothetical protein
MAGEVSTKPKEFDERIRQPPVMMRMADKDLHVLALLRTVHSALLNLPWFPA